ncbi:hypothetical protein [Rickettsia endosymbiont of Gonocerus acuteangulatus]|uniref:hypothetical protein n=1 Tax=Rickettsia endosymbiont of Gonocerus acuteangulatus TaxID=3066266 RepID=UPI003132B132
MLKAVYDGIHRAQQEMAEFYQEQWAIEKSMKIENAPISYYIEPQQYYGKTYAMFGSKYRKDGERSCCCI